jgi:2-octaprenyl-6-methoxyphenol hydroxylase
MANSHDIVIVGGGMVGASLAVALAPLPLRIAVVEAWPPASDAQPSYDDRATAVAHGSRLIFDAIGCWRPLAEAAMPIHRIHVSDRGRFGFTRMDCRDHGLDALGYVIENRMIGPALWARIETCDNVQLLCPARVSALAANGAGVEVTIDPEGGTAQTLNAALVIAADGARSPLRAMAGIEADVHDYGQTAIIANVTTSKPHANEAFERFTDQGPLAMLPMAGQRSSLVWTLGKSAAEQAMAAPDEVFLDDLQQAFGFRLGRIEQVGKRQSYPLKLVRARAQTAPRVVLIGNAAHSLHPVAGQGFNLGLRDVAALAEVLAEAGREGADPGSPPVLEAYDRWRREDHERVITLTDSLVRLFTNPLGPVKAARALALLGLDLLPMAKAGFVRQATGLAGRLPRLARGLPVA